MILKRLLLISLISISHLYGQDIKSDYDKGRDLKEGNQIDKYLKFDFSNLLTPKTDFLGFIGADYRRLRLIFQSVTKGKNKYLVKGFSIADKNNCDFSGEILIRQIKEYKDSKVYVDSLNRDITLKARGYLIGQYKFNENKDQKNTGTFQGIVKLYWYLDNDNKIQFDNLEGFSDRYRNNQYKGTWKSYYNDKEMICNWGEFRIPDSGDLDIGAGEFSPNPKYLKNGWVDLEIK